MNNRQWIKARGLRRLVTPITALCLAASGAACGTRVRSETAAPATPAVSEVYRESSPTASAPALAPSGTVPIATDPGRPQPKATTGGETKPGTLAPANNPAQAPRPGTAVGSAGQPATGSLQGAPKTPALPQPTPAGAKSDIVVASVGTLSGPLGAVLVPMLRGAQIWVKWTNERGGLNGHKIDLVTYDDGGDPARHSAQVREAVERKGAIGFLMNTEVVTGQSSSAYLTEKRLPVIGLTGGEYWVANSPVYFPQKASLFGLYRVHPEVFAAELVHNAVTKWGILTCVEVQGCADLAKTYADEAKPLGYNLVYSAKASLAQPDYTAECLAARNAGVQAIHVNLDPSAVERFVTACARQAYKPVVLIPATAVVDRSRLNPNLDGALAVGDVYPWFASGIPAIDEYHEALSRFGQGLEGAGPVQGWVAGKLFEKAAAGISEPPTSAQLLTGLWKIKNDTLGGLTGALTFTENQPAPQLACGTLLMIKNQKWVSPDPKIKCY